MKATEASLLEFIKRSNQFSIPVYQRTYSWTEKECRQLWEDVLRSGSDEQVPVHFMGSIVYIQSGQFAVMDAPPLLVIDGQQRLTSVTLLLLALEEAVGNDEPASGFSREKIRDYYLINRLEKGNKNFKLLLSQTDRDTLVSIIAGRVKPANHSIRVTENLKFFRDLLKDQKKRIPQICKGVAKLMVVDVSLTRGQDNPQLIFESMNSTGKELSQADLIRNYVLMGLEQDLQTRLYEDYWRPMELEFGQEAYGSHFDSFMRDYLTIVTGEIPNLSQVYEAFKSRNVSLVKDFPKASDLTEILCKELREYSRYYCNIALGHETDADLRIAFSDLRELKVDVAYPFILEVYSDLKNSVLPKEDVLEIIRIVEAYVFRRAVCTIPTNSLNKTFATLTKNIRKDRYVESVKAHFLGLPSYKRFPSNLEFEREIQYRDLYNFRSRAYWLRRVENFGKKELVSTTNYSIEHILPQNDVLSKEWRNDLGANWREVQEKWLHRLGNLTLTAYNSEYSDKPFKYKRDMPTATAKGLRSSPLRLNEGLGLLEKWDESAIIERGQRLAILAQNVWKAPTLPAEVMATYAKKAEPKQVYEIGDHPNLSEHSKMRGVFDALRKEILALDAGVNEEILKLYVAYKAETNFVDIVPQVSRLRLSINMDFADLIDPKGLCKDIRGVGRWGNGDAELGVSALEEIPYALSLIRQALDQQLGGSDSR